MTGETEERERVTDENGENQKNRERKTASECGESERERELEEQVEKDCECGERERELEEYGERTRGRQITREREKNNKREQKWTRGR